MASAKDENQETTEVDIGGHWCRRCSCTRCQRHLNELHHAQSRVDQEVQHLRRDRVGVATTRGSSVPAEEHLDALLRPAAEERKRSQQLELMAQHLLDLADSVVCGDALVVRESEMRSGDVVCYVYAIETRESLMNTLYRASELWQVLERRGVELMDAAARVRGGEEHRRKGSTAWSGAPKTQQDLHDLKQAVREYLEAISADALPHVQFTNDDRRNALRRMERSRTALARLHELIGDVP